MNIEPTFSAYKAYYLDLEILNRTKVFVGKRDQNKNYIYETEPRSLIAAAVYLYEKKIINVKNILNFIELDCEDGRYQVCQRKGQLFAPKGSDDPNTIGYRIFYIMCLLMLKGGGLEAICDTHLFLYETAFNLHYPGTRYTFFAAYESNILIEQIYIHIGNVKWIDGILTLDLDERLETWSGENDYRQAQIYWLYKKFYSETRTGQILKIKRHLLSSPDFDISRYLDI